VDRVRGEAGQSTVELALTLPVFVLILAALIEAGMLGLDQLRLWHAAREAARVAVVDSDPDETRTAAERSGLAPIHVTIDPEVAARTSGEPLTVHVAYRPGGHVPLVGDLLFGGITLNAEATMRIERP
jgi:Flp pilus assembly protein TadG